MKQDLYLLVPQTWIEKKYGNFYGKYLDKLKTLDLKDETLFKIQQAKLKIMETEQLKRITKMNNELLPLLNISVDQERSEIIESAVDNFVKMTSILNSPFISNEEGLGQFLTKKANSKKYVYQGSYSKEDIHAFMNQQGKNLVEVLNELQIDAPVSDKVKELFLTKAGSLRHTTKKYKQIKAAELEHLIATFIDNQGKKIRAVQSGQVFLNQEQILQDALVFTKDSLNQQLKGKNLFFHITTNGKKSASQKVENLQDLLTAMEQLKENQTVSITDELYSAINNLKLASIQVKSGFSDQPILNLNKERNAISFTEMQLSPIMDFLKNEHMNQRLREDVPSEQFTALTNYELSRNIAKTNITQNEIYFTKHGFATASQILKEYNHLLVFNPDLTNMKADDFFTSRHRYFFRTVDNK